MENSIGVYGSGLPILLTYIASWLIMPIFNKFEPLKDTVLKDKINTYSNEQAFQLSGIYQMDG